MADPVDALVNDLVDWIGNAGRPYPEVMDAWRTSCPRLPVWEEANRRGLLKQVHRSDAAFVELSDEGRAMLARQRLAVRMA